MFIASRPIGGDAPCFIIAEIGLAHNGDPALAEQLIHAAADAGVDAVKFQKRDVDSLAIGSVLHAPDTRFPAFGSTYYEVRKHIELDQETLVHLRDVAAQRGVLFFCTPFDIPSLSILRQLNMPVYKIASHCVVNLPLLREVAHDGKPVVLSTGMCTWEELDQAVEALQGCDLALMHCISAYPTPPEDTNLRILPALAARYGCPVGYSGHDPDNMASLLAVGMGAKLVERHITLDRSMMGFDHHLSLTPPQFAELVRDIRKVEQLLGSSEKQVRESEWVTRRKYHVSLVTAREIAAGECLDESMVTFKNPGIGLPPSALPFMLGRYAMHTIAADTLIHTEDFRSAS